MKLTKWRNEGLVFFVLFLFLFFFFFFFFSFLFLFLFLFSFSFSFSFHTIPSTQLTRKSNSMAFFHSRTIWHIDCHKNRRNAGNCRHTLRERSLVTDIEQYHISVYQLRSPRKGKNKTDFTSIEFSIASFHGLAKKGIFRIICTCQCKTRFHFMGHEKIKQISLLSNSV